MIPKHVVEGPPANSLLALLNGGREQSTLHVRTFTDIRCIEDMLHHLCVTKGVLGS